MDPIALLSEPAWDRLRSEITARMAAPCPLVAAVPYVGYGWYSGTIGKLTGIRNDRQFTPGRSVVAVSVNEGTGWLCVAVGDRKGNFIGKDAPITMPVVTPADHEKLIDDAVALIRKVATQLGFGTGTSTPKP